MKKLILMLSVLALTCTAASAQSLVNRLENLGNRAKNHIEYKVESKVNHEVDRAIDNAMNANTYKKSKKGQSLDEGAVWTCPACKHEGNSGKFCPECGAKMPAAPSGTWKCSKCGATDNSGKFCTECGAKKPAKK